MQKYTLADVAREAKVGKATASRALNGLKSVAPSTRERVLQAAKKLHFVPDAVSQRLSARRSLKIRGIAQTAQQYRGRLAYLDCPQHPIPDSELKHAKESAANLGFDLEYMTIIADQSGSQLRQLWGRGVEGLMIRGEQGTFPGFKL